MSDHADRRRHRRGGSPRRGTNTGGSGGGGGLNNSNVRRGASSGTRISQRDTPRKDSDRDTPPTPTPSPITRPIILTKPERRDVTDSATALKQVDNAIIMVKARDDASKPKSILPADQNRLKNSQTPSPVPTAQDVLSPDQRLHLPSVLAHSVKVLDENLQWSDTGLEHLLDQTDFLVIGVVGMENCGKSTLMSLLSGGKIGESLVFKPARGPENCTHQTIGVDMYVTYNRLIFLDTQPVLSASVLDAYNRSERKLGGEYNSAENMMEIQSLQLTSFLYTVCHVVLVVQDWFADPYFLKFLTTAEMLRPSIPSVSGGSNSDNSPLSHDEFSPSLVMLLNKARRRDFTINSMNSMAKTVAKCFEKSKLRHRGLVRMPTRLCPQFTKQTITNNTNIYLLPNFAQEPDLLADIQPHFKGHPPFDELLKDLKRQIYRLPRQPFTNAQLSERNWFHYAARMWENVKKSQLFADYTRLLP